MAMFAFSCPACKKQLRIRDAAASKKVRCPGCHAVFAVSNPLAEKPTVKPEDERPNHLRESLSTNEAKRKRMLEQLADTVGGDAEGAERKPNTGDSGKHTDDPLLRSALNRVIPGKDVRAFGFAFWALPGETGATWTKWFIAGTLTGGAGALMVRQAYHTGAIAVTEDEVIVIEFGTSAGDAAAAGEFRPIVAAASSESVAIAAAPLEKSSAVVERPEPTVADFGEVGRLTLDGPIRLTAFFSSEYAPQNAFNAERPGKAMQAGGSMVRFDSAWYFARVAYRILMTTIVVAIFAALVGLLIWINFFL